MIGAVRVLKTGKHFMLNYQLSPRGAETGLFVLMDVGHIFAVRDFDWLVGGVPVRFGAIKHLGGKYFRDRHLRVRHLSELSVSESHATAESLIVKLIEILKVLTLHFLSRHI